MISYSSSTLYICNLKSSTHSPPHLLHHHHLRFEVALLGHSWKVARTQNSTGPKMIFPERESIELNTQFILLIAHLGDGVIINLSYLMFWLSQSRLASLQFGRSLPFRYASQIRLKLHTAIKSLFHFFHCT